ncbi:helix-turn-helix domain-containing protein [Thermoactinomyces mirandus]|uniref:Helix-turn-helix transcriptional regulator n=1 Tax=Thermoactinomyces mirandus TaxID=2756294 RepID=A0A7W1XRX7_9BACL|nr:helix-turn-helix transcriptional regulator [Thermoactinomyces mirandus]MBA4602188.1 helix-turn-helix transcriptional regulator [Thermoactinomyces mirandus]
MKTKHLDRTALGEFIKNARREKRLNQSELVDDILSQSIISYIETGQSASIDKIVYLLNRLALDPDEILEKFMIVDDREEDAVIEEWILRLNAVECLISLEVNLGTEILRSVNLPSGHSFQAWVEYLKGKLYYSRQKWEKAQNHFLQGLQLLRQNQQLRSSNLESACLHQLSRIEYLQNRFQMAVQYSKKALMNFNPKGERKYYKGLILVSQAIYLEKLNRIGEANALLDEFGSEDYPFLSYSKEATLNVFEMKAKLLAKSQQFPQAIEIGLQGIELARIDRNIERSFELWTTLGGIYLEMDKSHLAEICFQTALRFRNRIKRLYLLAYVHVYLGRLYYKQKVIEKAEKEFSQALEYSKKVDIFWEVESLIGLGKCSLSYDANKAMNYFQKALDMAKKHQLDDKKTELLLFLAQCFIQLENPRLQNVAMDLLYSQLEALKGGDDSMVNAVKRHSAGDPPGD